MKLNKKAFTLIELIITIAIISLIAMAVFVSVNPAKRIGETKDSQRYSDLTAISKAVNIYTADNGSMPTDIDTTNIKKGDKITLCSTASELTCDGQTHDCLVIDDTNFLGPYLTTLPVDPDNQDATDTGYYITRNADKTITFGACSSYDQGASLTVAATTKVDSFIGIYRSVGPSNTTALASGTTNAMTISGNDLTLTTALADNIGVGDVIQYDSNNSGTVDSLAFIQSRYSSTRYSVVDVDGDTPTETTASDTDWDIFRAYTSLYSAERGTENTAFDNTLENFDTWSGGKDLVTAGQQWNIALYADAADTQPVDITSWTTDAEHYLKIYTPYLISEVGITQRHSGVWDDNAYNLNISVSGSDGTAGIVNRVHYVRIDGLQLVYNFNSTSIYGYAMRLSVGAINTPNTEIHASNNIIKGNITGGTVARGLVVLDRYLSVKIFNNIVYDFDSNNVNTGTGIAVDGDRTYVYNNTVYNSNIGIRDDDGSPVFKNNIVQNCVDGYNGGFDAGSDYNISDVDQTDADSANATFNGYKTVNFAGAGADNFHLAAGDTAAQDAGTDLSSDVNLSFTKDIDGETRSGTWDIGADEYQ